MKEIPLRYDSRSFTATVSILVGLTLVANPIYFDLITIYPNGGVIFAPFHSSTLSIGGLLLTYTGIGRAVGIKEKLPIGRAVILITLASIATFIIFETLAILVSDSTSGYTVKSGIRKTVVAAVIASSFSFAGTVRAHDALGGLLSVALAAVFLLIGFFEWQFDPLLGPLLDLWFLLTGGPIWGINYSGSLLILLIILLGLWVGKPET